MTNCEPWPGCEVTTILPPCSRTIFCETGKPRPVPREPLVEAKTWKIEAMSASSMPTPLSLTVIRAIVARRRPTSVATTTRAPVGPLAGVDRVGDDVQDGAVDAVGVDHDLGHVVAGLPGQRHAELRGARLHQLDDVADRLVQVGRLERGLAVLGEREHVHDQVVDLGLVLLDDRPAAADDACRPSR